MMGSTDVESPVPYFGRSSAPRTCSQGQGKVATTILADQGDVVTVITDVPYKIRSRHVVIDKPRRGLRSMHRTTLQIPTSAHTEYSTTNQHNYGGSREKPTPEKRCPFPTQFSHISFAHEQQGEQLRPWLTNYDGEFINKGSQPPAKLHYPAFYNRMAMQEGAEAKRAITAGGPLSGPGETNFWTQYNRIHNKLGAIRGPGIPREYPDRLKYNPITGQETGVAWQPDNKRTSGNRILYHGSRKDADKEFIY